MKIKLSKKAIESLAYSCEVQLCLDYPGDWLHDYDPSESEAALFIRYARWVTEMHGRGVTHVPDEFIRLVADELENLFELGGCNLKHDLNTVELAAGMYEPFNPSGFVMSGGRVRPVSPDLVRGGVKYQYKLN